MYLKRERLWSGFESFWYACCFGLYMAFITEVYLLKFIMATSIPTNQYIQINRWAAPRFNPNNTVDLFFSLYLYHVLSLELRESYQPAGASVLFLCRSICCSFVRRSTPIVFVYYYAQTKKLPIKGLFSRGHWSLSCVSRHGPLGGARTSASPWRLAPPLAGCRSPCWLYGNDPIPFDFWIRRTQQRLRYSVSVDALNRYFPGDFVEGMNSEGSSWGWWFQAM